MQFRGDRIPFIYLSLSVLADARTLINLISTILIGLKKTCIMSCVENRSHMQCVVSLIVVYRCERPM